MYIYFLHPISLSPLIYGTGHTEDPPDASMPIFYRGYYTGIQGWEFSVEGYSKMTKNVLEYKDGNTLVGNSIHWEEKVEMGKGRNFGIEFMLEKKTGRTTGWINYTLAKATVYSVKEM